MELEPDEKADLAKRLPHVRAATKNERLLLTQEIMESIGYEDSGALDLLRRGSPLLVTYPNVQFSRLFTSLACLRCSSFNGNLESAIRPSWRLVTAVVMQRWIDRCFLRHRKRSDLDGLWGQYNRFQRVA